MPHIRPTAAALLLGFSIFAITSAPIAGAGHSAQHTYDVSLFADEDKDEQLVVIRQDRDDMATGIEGMDDAARLLRGRAVESASRRIHRLADANDVSLVDVDSEGSGQVTIVAEDADGGTDAYISIGENGIEIHADGDNGDGVHISFGNSSKHHSDDGAVRIHARGDDDSDRTVVLLKNLDAESTRDFIDDLEGVPRELKREMLRELDL